MKLLNLLNNVDIINTNGNLEVDITNIHSDSRKIKESNLYK